MHALLCCWGASLVVAAVMVVVVHIQRPPSCPRLGHGTGHASAMHAALKSAPVSLQPKPLQGPSKRPRACLSLRPFTSRPLT